MNTLTVASPSLVAPDPQTLGYLRDLDATLRPLPQIEIPVDHILHGGMYARTVLIPAETVVSGVLLRRATMLVVSGDLTMFSGTHSVRLTGYHALPGSAGRKSLFKTHTDTHMTMLLPTGAQSVVDAEREFTSEPELLMKRSDRDTVTITREEP